MLAASLNLFWVVFILRSNVQIEKYLKIKHKEVYKVKKEITKKAQAYPRRQS